MGIIVQAVKQKMPFRTLRLLQLHQPLNPLIYISELSLYLSLEYKARFIFFKKTSHMDTSQISGGCYFDVQMCIVLFSIQIFFIISSMFPLQMVMGKTLKQLLLVTSFIVHFGRHLVIMPRGIA